MDIEILATSAVKERIALCDGLYSFINEREKEPSFDGSIHVYPKGTNRKELQIGRVPVQIKGESNSIRGRKTTYKHSAEISDLKIYLKDGGIIYFVVVIDDKGNKTIFYNSLLPYDLNKILKNTEKNKRKTITMHLLPEDNNSIRQLFLAFIDNKERQAAKIIWTDEQARKAVRDGASLRLYIQPKQEPKNYTDIMKEATTQSIYLYMKTKDGVEFPFDKIEGGHTVISRELVDLPVFVNGIKYYDSISHGYENGKSFLYIGQAVKIPLAEEGDAIKNLTFKCTLDGMLSNRIEDSNFLLAVANTKKVIIGDKITFDIHFDDQKEITEMKCLNKDFKRIKLALDYFGVCEDLNMNVLTDIDFRNINMLIQASEGSEIIFEKEGLSHLFYYNRKIGNISVRILAKKEGESQAYKLYNAFQNEVHVRLEIMAKNGKRIIAKRWLLFLYMKAEDFLCSNISYNIIINSIKSMKSSDRKIMISISDTQNVSASDMLLESISAYDSQTIKDECLLKFAEELAEILLGKDPGTIINKFQIIKRKRPLSNDEIATLVMLRNKNKEDIIKCAASILLGESDEAKKLLGKLPEDERKRITDYPIYKLLL